MAIAIKSYEDHFYPDRGPSEPEVGGRAYSIVMPKRCQLLDVGKILQRIKFLIRGNAGQLP